MKASVERSAAEAAPERRRSPRADFVVRVEYQTVDELFSDFARNINEGGIFVATERPLQLGTPVTLQFRIPGSEEPVVSTGRVVRVDGSGSGMGIEFEELEPRARDRINELVRDLRSAPPRRGPRG